MINKEYLQEKALRNAQRVFSTEGSVQLQAVLDQKMYLSLLEGARRLYMHHIYEPLFHSYRSAPFMNKKIISTMQELNEKVVKSPLTLHHATLLRFQHKDYTLLYDEMKKEIGILAFLELTPHWKAEFGGTTFFMKKNQEFLRIIPAPNTLAMVNMDENIRRFVKYINHTSSKRKRYVIEFFFTKKD